MHFDSYPKCSVSPPPLPVFLRDPAGPCPTTSLCKLLPDEGCMGSRNCCCLRQRWGQQRKAIRGKFHLIHPVFLKKSLSHAPKKFSTTLSSMYSLRQYDPLVPPPLRSLWLASNPKIPFNFSHRRVPLSLDPFPAHHSYAKGVSSS